MPTRFYSAIFKGDKVFLDTWTDKPYIRIRYALGATFYLTTDELGRETRFGTEFEAKEYLLDNCETVCEFETYTDLANWIHKD